MIIGNFHGNPKNWQAHQKILLNLFWALSLSKIETIQTVKMSFAGSAVFITDSIDAEKSINQMSEELSEKLNQNYQEKILISSTGKR